VKIYRDRKRSGDYFRLVFYLSGKRHRLNFNFLDAAKKEAAAKAAAGFSRAGNQRMAKSWRIKPDSTHLGLDVGVRLQTDCHSNECPEAPFASQ
jgi:hypothetical protein